MKDTAHIENREGGVRIADSPTGGKTWVVVGYDEALQVFGDAETYANALYRTRFLAVGVVQRTEPDGSPVQTLASDPPMHTRIRRLVSQVFTARRVESMRPRLEEQATALIKAMLDNGSEADLYQALALPFPAAVICQLLGVPESDQPEFRRWADIMAQTGPTADMNAVKEVKDQLEEYFGTLIELRRREPADNLLSALIQKQDTDDALTTAELQSLVQVILLAGHETTVNQIGLGLVLLMRERERWDRLVADPSVVPAVVEEILRLETVTGDALPGVPRYTTHEVELGGHTIPSDTVIWVDTAAANLDPARFTRPHEFDPSRKDNSHIAFGHGIHFCLGAHLARVEIQVALGLLARMVPTLRLAVDPAELVIHPGMGMRGYRSIPVTW